MWQKKSLGRGDTMLAIVSALESAKIFPPSKGSPKGKFCALMLEHEDRDDEMTILEIAWYATEEEVIAAHRATGFPIILVAFQDDAVPADFLKPPTFPQLVGLQPDGLMDLAESRVEEFRQRMLSPDVNVDVRDIYLAFPNGFFSYRHGQRGTWEFVAQRVREYREREKAAA